MSGTLNTCATQDEAIELAVRESQPGDVVVVHEVECKVTLDGENYVDEATCTCTPMTMTIGASA